MGKAWDELTNEERSAAVLLATDIARDGRIDIERVEVRYAGARVDRLAAKHGELPTILAALGAIENALSSAIAPFDMNERMAKFSAEEVAAMTRRLGPLPEKKIGQETWRKCCGIWWTETAWRLPEAEGESYGATFDGACGKCRFPLERVSQRPYAVLDEQPDELEIRERLRDVEEGDWVPFQAVVVPTGIFNDANVYVPGRAETVALPLEGFFATHLAIDDTCGPLVIDHGMVGRYPVLDGPLPSRIFSVRFSADVRRPVDRGARLFAGPYDPTRKPTILYPSNTMKLRVANYTAAPINFRGALLGRYFNWNEGPAGAARAIEFSTRGPAQNLLRRMVQAAGPAALASMLKGLGPEIVEELTDLVRSLALEGAGPVDPLAGMR